MRLGFVGFNGLELEALLAGLRFRASQVFTLQETLPEGLVLDAVLASDSAWQAWSENTAPVVNPTLHLLPWLVLSAYGGPLAPASAHGVHPHQIDIRARAALVLDVTQRWLNQRIGSPGVRWPHRSLRERNAFSRRENEVLALLSQGSSNEEISTALGIRTATVKTYLRRIFERMGALNRAHAVALYADLRLSGSARNG